MQLRYLFSPAAAIFMSAALFSSATNDEETVSMSSTSSSEMFEPSKTSLTSRVGNVEDQMTNMEIKKTVSSKNPLHGFVNLELLYWRAQGNHWIYAYTLDSGQALPASLTAQSEGIKNIRGKSEWKPGSRLEVGVSTVHNWNISGIWTYYHNRSTSSHSASNGLAGNILLQGTKAGSCSKINYNLGDLEFSSSYGLLKNLCLKPYISARGAWINQIVRNHYSGDGVLYILNGMYRQSSEWNGFGPRVGTNVAYHFGKSCFSFIGGLSGSILYGNAHMKSNLNFNNNLGVPISIEMRDHCSELKTNLQAFIGADLKWHFDHCKKAFCLHAEWETNYWWNVGGQATPIRLALTDQISSQDLIMSGVSGGVAFEY